MDANNATRGGAQPGAANVNSGCAATALVAALLLAAGLRIVPAHRSNAELIEAAGAIAGQDSAAGAEDILEQIREVARALNIHEALAPHAISVSRVSMPSGWGGAQNGMCAVRIKYTRRISIGIAKISLSTDEEIAKPFFAAENQ